MHTLFLWLRTLLNLEFTGKFDMASPFDSEIEFSRIVGRNARQDFSEAMFVFRLGFELSRFMNKFPPFPRFFLFRFVQPEENKGGGQQTLAHASDNFSRLITT